MEEGVLSKKLTGRISGHVSGVKRKGGSLPGPRRHQTKSRFVKASSFSHLSIRYPMAKLIKEKLKPIVNNFTLNPWIFAKFATTRIVKDILERSKKNLPVFSRWRSVISKIRIEDTSSGVKHDLPINSSVVTSASASPRGERGSSPVNSNDRYQKEDMGPVARQLFKQLAVDFRKRGYEVVDEPTGNYGLIEGLPSFTLFRSQAFLEFRKEGKISGSSHSVYFIGDSIKLRVDPQNIIFAYEDGARKRIGIDSECQLYALVSEGFLKAYQAETSMKPDFKDSPLIFISETDPRVNQFEIIASAEDNAASSPLDSVRKAPGASSSRQNSRFWRGSSPVEAWSPEDLPLLHHFEFDDHGLELIFKFFD